MTQNPFPGATYREEHHPWFFGREPQTKALKRQICTNRFVVLSGPPHVGKTSLMFGGVIPELKENGYKGLAGTKWRVAQFIPSNNPVGQLTRAIARKNILHPDEKLSPTYQDSIRRILLHDKRGLIEAYLQSTSIQDYNLLIVLDQCEDFLSTDLNDDKKYLLDLLLTASMEPLIPIYVVMAMRSDSLSQLELFEPLANSSSTKSFKLHLMSSQALISAIKRPIDKAGANIAEELSKKLLLQLYDDPHQLMSLQAIMFQLWKVWSSSAKGKGTITEKHLEKALKNAKAEKDAEKIEIKRRSEKEGIRIGEKQREKLVLSGEEEELEEHFLEEPEVEEKPKERADIIEELFAGLSVDDQKVCAYLFKALTQKNKRTKGKIELRPTMIETLADISATSANKIILLANQFRQSGEKVLMPMEGELNLYSNLELTDLKLVDEWPRLGNWVEEESKDANQFLEIAKAAADNYPMDESDLRKAIKWWGEFKPTAIWGNQYEYFPAVENHIGKFVQVKETPPPPPKPQPKPEPTPPPQTKQQPPVSKVIKPKPQRPKIKIKGKRD
ncbi:MAG: ATP-binding protein [Bacteroidota bacterium]